MGQRVGVAARILFVLILVYCFLVSIGLMGAAFKGFGKGFAETLISTTSNPFVGLFIGVLATSLVQSSSTTTSIVVGMVGSGVLTVSNAIPIVMGANIGTTVTNTIVSLGHVSRREEFRRAIAGATVHDFFNLICVLIMFPLNLATGFLEKLAWYMEGLFDGVGGIKFTSPIKMITKPVIDAIEHILIEWLHLSDRVAYIVMVGISVVILFFALVYLVKTMRSLVIERVESVLDDVLGKNAVLAIVGGAVLTAIIQSSSITTSLLVPMIAAGILSLEAAFPIVIGANIGTTGTAILASFATGNPSAIVIAFVHFLFNLIGVVVIYPIKPFRTIPINLAKALGDLAYEKRHYAIMYVLGVFFVAPGLLVLVYKLLT
jgi:solute carrier family 34 (sodium-dependent phosphate cotransporter)